MPDNAHNNYKQRLSEGGYTSHQRLRIEQHFSALIRHKLNALCNEQLKQKKNHPDNKISKTSKNSLKEIAEELRLLFYSVGLKSKKRNDQTPQASTEEKLMVRFDYDGWFFPIKDTDLSPLYARAISTPQHLPSQYKPYARHNPQKYDLDQIPIWRNSMKKFANYRKLNQLLRQQFSILNLPPCQIKQLNFYDLMHIIFEKTRQKKQLLFEPRGCANTRMFAACYANEYRRVMSLMGQDNKSIEHTLALMKRGLLPRDKNRHHKLNVQDCKELKDISKVNDFDNFLIVTIDPIHRGLHLPADLCVDKSIVFMAGYDPLFQIRRKPEIERQYLLHQQKIAKKKEELKRMNLDSQNFLSQAKALKNAKSR